MITAALIIRDPWIGLILSGRKDWEMRKTATRKREMIGLIRQGSGLVVGTARIIDSLPPLSRADYMDHQHRHAVPEEILDEVMANAWLHPWVLTDARRLPEPVPYMHRSGAVTFVALDPKVAHAVDVQLPDSVEPKTDVSETHSRASAPYNQAGSGTSPVALTDMEGNLKAVPTNLAVDPEIWFVLRREKAQAFGRPAADRAFLVQAGSTAMRHGSPNEKRNRGLRDRLVRQQVLVPDANPALYRFSRNYEFTSPSSAAGVVIDGNASGPQMWIDPKTGRSLKDLLG